MLGFEWSGSVMPLSAPSVDMAETDLIRFCGACQYAGAKAGFAGCGYKSKHCPCEAHRCSKCGKSGHDFHDCKSSADVADQWYVVDSEEGQEEPAPPLVSEHS